MIKNYFLLAVKNFRKQRMFSLINVLGLSISIVCCMMIYLFVMNEFSFDTFHKNGKNIYRVMRVSTSSDQPMEVAYLSPPYATALQNDYPDAVEKVVRISPDNDLITYNNISFNEKKIYLVDSNFFSFFSFPLLKGDANTVLENPNSIVMTETTAKKYFGNEDPIGKVVEFNKDLRLTVTGIAKDVPANSHLEFDMIVPLSNWRNDAWFNQWPSNSLFTYVQLKDAVNPEQLKKQFPAFMEKYLGDFYRESGFKMELTIKPLEGIYFEGESKFDPVKHGSKKMVYIFMTIAVFILVIACINFMNLATARAADRSKEVGLRKVLGAVRKQLAWQFIFESLLFATIAAIIAIVILVVTMAAYNSFLGYALPSFYNDPKFYAFVVAIIFIVGLLAGSYPALMLSSFSPIESLKGKLRLGSGGVLFRKVLVVFQFAISVLLIASVTIVMKQMHFVLNTDLGFNKEQSMIVRLDNEQIRRNRIQFKNELESDPTVSSVSLMSGEPGGFHDRYGFEAEGKPGEKLMFNTEYADFEYVKTLGLKLIAGRDFSADFPTDTVQSVLINRAAATTLGYTPEQAVGKWIRNLVVDSANKHIVGVIEDYHFTSLKETIAPLVIASQRNDRRLALIKLKTAGISNAINRIKKYYSTAAPDYPFEYDFLDQRFDMLYRSEMKMQTLLSVFAGIAICIACLGLFGLTAYTAAKRTKEIGVRKVLGSTMQNIVLLLSKDLLKPVLFGTAIAVPAAWLIIQKWLQGFAYRTDVHWWLFAGAAMVAVLIALITVSVQAIKAALANPVKSLRTE
jgi:putative ABC transport system permease protein